MLRLLRLGGPGHDDLEFVPPRQTLVGPPIRPHQLASSHTHLLARQHSFHCTRSTIAGVEEQQGSTTICHPLDTDDSHRVPETLEIYWRQRGGDASAVVPCVLEIRNEVRFYVIEELGYS